MERPEWMRLAVAAGNELHHLKQPVARHNRINLLWTAALLLALPSIFAAGAVLPAWLFVPLGSLALGCVLLGVFVLVLHECSHGMFLLGADRAAAKRLNHQIGRLVGDLTFTAYEEHWERGHVAHHLSPCVPGKDPQDPDPLDGARFWRMAALHLLPGFSVVANPSRRYGLKPRRLLLSVGLWGGIALLSGLSIGPAGPLVVLYGFNVVSLLNQLKKVQEHGAGLAFVEEPLMRSRTYFYPTQRLTSPFFIHYHWEHHANFSVPWYLLPEYHARVQALMPPEVAAATTTRGLGAYLAQVNGLRRPPAPMGSALPAAERPGLDPGEPAVG